MKRSMNMANEEIRWPCMLDLLEFLYFSSISVMSHAEDAWMWGSLCDDRVTIVRFCLKDMTGGHRGDCIIELLDLLGLLPVSLITKSTSVPICLFHLCTVDVAMVFLESCK